MKYLYKHEIEGHLNKTANELHALVEGLVASENANSWQMVTELSNLLRKNRRYEEAVDAARQLFERDKTVERLNMLFVAVVDQSNIPDTRKMAAYVDAFLQERGITYHKQLFPTWLKAANRLADDAMFKQVYVRIPSDEKTCNSYVIAQYYVYLNRRGRWTETVEHYQGLTPEMQASRYVRKYYENACMKLGKIMPEDDESDSAWSAREESRGTTCQDEGQKSKSVFLVYGGTPPSLGSLEFVLDSKGVSYIDLCKTINGSPTIIEAFEREASKASVALVLVTMEDEMPKGKWRARQNVLLECGYFMAKLGRERVCILLQKADKEYDEASDLSGIYHIDMDKGDWMGKLFDYLDTCGIA